MGEERGENATGKEKAGRRQTGRKRSNRVTRIFTEENDDNKEM
jgi:hypothetical protein